MNAMGEPKPRIGTSAGIGCALALGVAVLLLGFVTGFQQQNLQAWWSTIRGLAADAGSLTGLAEPDQMLNFVQENPDKVSLVVYSIDENGRPLTDEHSLFWQADTPVPTVGLGQLLLLATYARQVEAGTLNPDQPVSMQDWQAFYLPNTDAQVHLQALNALAVPTTRQGLAEDPTQTVALGDVVWAMIRFSDEAAADYLLTLFGPAAIETTLVEAGLPIDLPLPTLSLGRKLSWRNHAEPAQSATVAAEKAALSAEERATVAAEWVTRYQQDASWREAEVVWRGQGGRVTDLTFELPLAAAYLPSVSAEVYAQAMAQVAAGTFISPAVSTRMQDVLGWPMNTLEVEAQFSRVGTKVGLQPGVISEVTYLTPREGSFAGQTRVTAILLHDLSAAAYLRLRQTLGYQRLMVVLATDADFFDEARTTLAR